MICDFCGKNFEPEEGFEEVKRGHANLVRCETCAFEQREQEYDWRSESRNRGSRGAQ